MSGADDLFSAEPARPVTDRLGTATWVLAIAAPLNVFGVFCFTGVPGALLTMWGWQIADEELHRVSWGALPADRELRARRLRGVGFVQLGIAGVSLLAQILLFGVGFYDGVAAGLVQLLGNLG